MSLNCFYDTVFEISSSSSNLSWILSLLLFYILVVIIEPIISAFFLPNFLILTFLYVNGEILSLIFPLSLRASWYACLGFDPITLLFYLMFTEGNPLSVLTLLELVFLIVYGEDLFQLLAEPLISRCLNGELLFEERADILF